MSKLSDAAKEADGGVAGLLIRVGHGDHAAFRDLYESTRGGLFRICLRICGNRSAADDVLQDVYMVVWQRAAAWEEGRGNSIAWLGAIARNRAIDWHRFPGRRWVELEHTPFEPADPTPSAEAALIIACEVRQLSDHVSELDPKFQDTIRAAFFDGVPYGEIAVRKGLPIGTVKSRIHNGLAKLKQGILLDDAASLTNVWPC